MSGNSRSFGRFVLCGLWLPVVLAVAAVAVQALRITSKPQTYLSLAKLVAGGRVQMGGAGVVGYREYLSDFYGNIIETLESSEMRKHAIERVRLLYPDLKEADVEVRVAQNKGSAIFNVAVIGSDRQYAQVFLNALLDEFKAFREMSREQQRNKAVQALAEYVMKADEDVRANADRLAAFDKTNNVVMLTAAQNEQADAIKALMAERRTLRATMAVKIDAPPPPATTPASQTPSPEFLVQQRDAEMHAAMQRATRQRVEEAQRRSAAVDREFEEVNHEVLETGAKLAEHERLAKNLQASESTHKEVFDLMHKFTVSEDIQGDYVTVMERASVAVEYVQPWSNTMIIAGGTGLAVGVLLLLLGALLWVATGPRQVSPPPLPAAP